VTNWGQSVHRVKTANGANGGRWLPGIEWERADCPRIDPSDRRASRQTWERQKLKL